MPGNTDFGHSWFGNNLNSWFGNNLNRYAPSDLLEQSNHPGLDRSGLPLGAQVWIHGTPTQELTKEVIRYDNENGNQLKP